MHSSTLSRTSSVASISSDDGTYLKQILGFEPRRTRRRFTSAQVMMLEQLFHQSSHPTREERETVAQAAGMEMKSVTIWFQNKRQTERKASHYATGQPNDVHRAASFPMLSSSPTLLSSPYASTSTLASASGTGPAPATAPPASTHPIRTHTRTLSNHSLLTPRRKITPPRARPSLDRVATRSESRLPPPRTPTRPRDPYASLWDNMPSSPLAPPASPPAHDLVEFLGGGGSRTLEWACAAARLAGKEREKERRRPCVKEQEVERDHDRERSRHGDGDHRRSRDRDREAEAELTEEDDVEAVTPEGSLGVSDAARWHGHGVQRARPRLALTPAPESVPEMASGKWPEIVYGDRLGKEVPEDEDMMRAALALCGLGRRSW